LDLKSVNVHRTGNPDGERFFKLTQ